MRLDPPPERHNVDYIIETDFQGPGFVPVPNAVAQDAALSAEALGVLVYLASLPRGFVLRVATVQERFGIGKDKWQRIARELRDSGAMDAQPVRGSGGRVVGKRVSVRWPDPSRVTDSRETRPSDRKPEKPTVGKSAKQSRKIRQSEPENPAPYKDKDINLRPRPARHGAHRSSVVSEGSASAEATGCDAGSLGRFQRSQLKEGKSVLIGGCIVEPGSIEAVQWLAALRIHATTPDIHGLDAEKGAVQ